MARPRKPNPEGGLVGAVLGGILGGPWGAVAGGALGVAGTGEKLPLEEALTVSLAPLSLSLVRLYRPSKFSIEVLVQDAHGKGFWVFRASAAVRMDVGAEQLEDELYESAMSQARDWRTRRAGA